MEEEELESNEDEISDAFRQRTELPWRAFGRYLSSGGVPLLLLLLISQLLKHSVMVAIDYWLAEWTSNIMSSNYSTDASMHKEACCAHLPCCLL